MNFKPRTARKLVNVNDITHQEWLMIRKKGIGGSDTGALVGIDKYKSKLDVYLDKINPLVDVNPPSEAAEMGHIMEPVIRNEFKRRNPHLKVYQSNFMWQSIDEPHLLANTDGLIFCKERGWGVLEIKNMSEYRLKEFGEEEMPISFIFQSHHYMKVLGLDYTIFAVFIGGNKYREFYVKRDEKVIEALVKIERHFWNNHVLAKNPPQPDGSEASGEALLKVFPGDLAKKEDEILTLPQDVKGLTEAYEFYKAEEEKMKKKKDEVKQQLMAMLGEYQKAEIEGENKKINWTIKKAFDAVKLREAQPELYKQFIKPTFDAASFRKSYPSEHKKFMVETKSRAFSITKK